MRLLRTCLYSCFMFVVCVDSLDSARAEDVALDAAPGNVTSFVTVGKARHGLTIPVKVAGRPLWGLIDTGSATSVFDTSLRGLLNGKAQRRSGDTPAGEISLDHYKAPNLIIAGSEVGGGRLEVACTDLSPIRQEIDEPVDIVVGMDVLRQFTISIYPRDGVVSCERSAPRRAKGGIAFSCDENGVPSIDVRATHLPPTGSDATSISFVIDSGFFTLVDGAVSHSVFDDLHGRDALTPYGTQKAVGLNGVPVELRDVRLQGNLELPGYVWRSPRFLEAEYNIVGLGFLLRYNVILDLRNCQAYFSVPVQDADAAKARKRARERTSQSMTPRQPAHAEGKSKRGRERP